MSSDIVLRCAPGGWFRRGIGLSITEPADVRATNGRLRDPPSGWSVSHRYYQGESNLQPLIFWLHKSLGIELLGAISKLALDAPTRLFITEHKASEEMLATPWEVLEETSGALQLMGNLHVIRSLPLPPRSGGADAIGASLRVLVTWADPTRNIPGLDEHLQWLDALPDASDSAVTTKVVEFTDAAVVRDAAHAFHPNVVYHFGHAEPIGSGKVSLRIGASGARQQLDGALYADLLRPFSPRILVVNACSTITGRSLSPYIGLSSECMDACESVVCMQTEVPAGAARRFGQVLLGDLADGKPLSRAVRHGRMAMLAGRSVPPFTKFIPVLFTRGRSDPAFDVDADERTRLRIRKRLEVDLQKVKPLLARTADAAIDALLANGMGVALIAGPASSGKSTTVRGRIMELFRKPGTVRVLYLSVGHMTWDADPAHRVRQVVNNLAAHYGWLTRSLEAMFRERSDVSAPHAIADLAVWLTEQGRSNCRTVIVVDDVPDDVASELVTLAANVVNDGLLVVITRAPHVDPQLGVPRIDVPFMTAGEIEPSVLARTGGMPYFVASIARGQPLDGSLLDTRLAAVDESALHALRLAALATVPLPRTWLESIGGAAEVASLANDHLLIESESRARLALPEVVRDRVATRFADDERALREELFAFFHAASQESPNGPVESELARSATLEAMRQALVLSRQTLDKTWLDRARGIAVDLHRVAMMEAGDPVAAKSLWDGYREVAQELGQFSEREADSCFAEALAGVGKVSLADDLLDAVIVGNELDDLHVRALILRSNVLKRLGRQGTFAERVHLLQQAVVLADRLVEENPEDDSLRKMLGNVEQSLGNAFGYGAHARIPDAERHLKRAAEIFDAIGDLRGHRARAEWIEIRRYNGLLSDEERAEAIATIRRQFEELVTPSMQRDAVGHLYELGRLETSPEARARWFRRAYERASDAFPPWDLHAALQWRLAELEMGKDVESELMDTLKKLKRFAEDSWSLRLRRDALHVLATRAFARGEVAAGTERLREALAIARHLVEKDEGQHDAEVRAALEQEGGHHGLRR